MTAAPLRAASRRFLEEWQHHALTCNARSSRCKMSAIRLAAHARCLLSNITRTQQTKLDSKRFSSVLRCVCHALPSRICRLTFQLKSNIAVCVDFVDPIIADFTSRDRSSA
ncbi:MAG: hypothetical protein ACK55Z_27300, partial [bacterium]